MTYGYNLEPPTSDENGNKLCYSLLYNTSQENFINVLIIIILEQFKFIINFVILLNYFRNIIANDRAFDIGQKFSKI